MLFKVEGYAIDQNGDEHEIEMKVSADTWEGAGYVALDATRRRLYTDCGTHFHLEWYDTGTDECNPVVSQLE